MTHWRSCKEQPYLGHWSLAHEGGYREATLVIAQAKSGLVVSTEKPKGERCVTLFFKGVPKPMVANTTNCKVIEALYGPHIEDWAGQAITLYVSETRNPRKGIGEPKMVPCLRVRPKKPTAPGESLPEAPPAATSEDDDEGAREPGAEG